MKYLNDNEDQFRVTIHATLIIHLKEELVESVDVEDQVIQVSLDLAV